MKTWKDTTIRSVKTFVPFVVSSRIPLHGRRRKSLERRRRAAAGSRQRGAACMEVRCRRAFAAIVIIAIVVFVSALWFGLSRATASAASGEGLGSFGYLESILFDKPLFDADEKKEKASFEKEFFSLDDEQDAMVSARAGLAGFSSKESPTEAFKAVDARMEKAGWILAASQAEGPSTYRKESGAYRWACVSCTEAGDATSVLVQYLAEEV